MQRDKGYDFKGGSAFGAEELEEIKSMNFPLFPLTPARYFEVGEEGGDQRKILAGSRGRCQVAENY